MMTLKFIGSKMVEVKYKDGLSQIGTITSFINAAVPDVAKRLVWELL